MKALIIYDSYFGNTEEIAQKISKVLGEKIDVEVIRISEIKPEHISGLNLLIVGSPTRAFRASTATVKFLKQIAPGGLEKVKIAAFDTRMSINDIHSKPLRFLVKHCGYAAEKIAKKIRKKGGEILIEPEGFLVNNTEGPIKEGEIERAEKWANKILGILF